MIQSLGPSYRGEYVSPDRLVTPFDTSPDYAVILNIAHSLPGIVVSRSEAQQIVNELAVWLNRTHDHAIVLHPDAHYAELLNDA